MAQDDPDARSLLAAGLRSSGYEVMEAADGMDAIDCIAASRKRGNTFTAVVMDVKLPLLNGLDVLCALRCADIETPVILVAAFGDASVRTEGHELGASFVLDKPFNLNDLRAAVQAATSARSNPVAIATPAPPAPGRRADTAPCRE